MKTHPRAKYPLESSTTPQCSVDSADPMYINFVMLEASLQNCSSYVRGRVLDIGCGFRPYEFSYYCRASKYIGLDYLTDRSKPDVIGSALDLPFEESSMDTVVSNETLEHVSDPARAVFEMYRVVKPEGYLILSCPAFWPRHEQPYDFFRYPYDGIIALIENAGFRLDTLYCRGKSYALVGQVIQLTGMSLLKSKVLRRVINSVFLWLDRKRDNDNMTLGWTVLAQKAKHPDSSAGTSSK